ncbi:pogo transposable element, putative [Talaromyces stipitatus ATCC 10500]|uniref:Pogo transposable element, putative n=1 Tax=Talaromyces stipitatus (strain ATCC 10500 / CBS 375.48 / QM 6759 / NRRL 1006) TaxID=441959 RepID=B8M081_TALSN|nr:pogo transposable element, putative [Talaromyces stipitatus ATCC 10500]EED21178.1 pogo transposable element, putative [Talaromyces stipitatus ATCC 10500]
MVKSRTKNDPSYEGRLSLAIDALNNEKITKLRDAARTFDVSLTTLRRRLKGSVPAHNASITRRKMTPTEEAVLRGWVFSLERRGVPPRQHMLHEMANILLAQRDPTKIPEKRQPDLKAKFARRLSYSRALCEDPVVIGGFFEEIKQLKEEYGIADEDIYNFDETGFAMGISSTAKVICSSDRSGKPSLIQPGNREWVTIVECVGSTGTVVPPLIIFKSGTNRAECYTSPKLPPDWSITHSPNGWTSDEIGLQWLERIFEPKTRPLTVGTYRLLILDGHSSHLTPGFDQACKNNNIIACCMPPHSSHLLQPLDVGVFSVLKRLYGAAVESRIRIGIYHVDKLDFLDMLYSVRIQTYTTQNIKSGFSHTGIVPYNPQKVLSQLQIAVREATPASIRPSTSSSSTWSPKTPYNARTLEKQAKSVKRSLNMGDLDSNSPSCPAFNQLIKGSLVVMHQAAILARENHNLREANDILQKRRTRRTKALQADGILTVAEGRELAQELPEEAQPPPPPNGSAPLQPAQRALPRCSNCWEIGHKRNRCPNIST